MIVPDKITIELHSGEGKGVLIFFAIIFLLCALFEVGLLAFAYFNADKVSCNGLWCTFTTVRSSSIESGHCTRNGIPINCSESVDIDKIMKEAFENE